MKHLILLPALFMSVIQFHAQVAPALSPEVYAHARIYPRSKMPLRVSKLSIRSDTAHYLNTSKRPAFIPLSDIRQIKVSNGSRIIPFSGIGALIGLLTGAQLTIDNPLIDQPLPVLIGTTAIGIGIGAGAGLFNKKWTNIYSVP